MPTKIDFRDCIHQGVAGPTAEDVLALVQSQFCMPGNRLAMPKQKAASVSHDHLTAVAALLGHNAFQQLLSDFRRTAGSKSLRDLPSFITRHRYGRTTPGLADLAALEIAIAEAELAPAIVSLGACCVPPELIETHPTMTVTFHPAWHWVRSEIDLIAWRSQLLAGTTVQHVATEGAPYTYRIFPHAGSIAIHAISALDHAFEWELKRGANIVAAMNRAHELGHFEPLHSLRQLFDSGAIISIELHPQPKET